MPQVREVTVNAMPVGRLQRRNPGWKLCTRCGIRIRVNRKNPGQSDLCRDCRWVLDLLAVAGHGTVRRGVARQGTARHG